MMELLFIGVLVVPTVLAFIGWLSTHSRITIDDERTPANYWGSYHTSSAPRAHLGVLLPQTHVEDIESATHAHTIGVHP
ncbi:MAG TPA: hypothetical protein V6C69_22530 [Trichormus sp.]|jgi:hypothetical protein